MSLFQLLIKRSQFDLGVSSFIERVFLFHPEYLKTYRLVCKEWNSFIIQFCEWDIREFVVVRDFWQVQRKRKKKSSKKIKNKRKRL